MHTHNIIYNSVHTFYFAMYVGERNGYLTVVTCESYFDVRKTDMCD